ncbi:MAG: hypothetical protein GX802_02500 [Clostridiales bacterium]|jgi:hypothetical protein|nr:hypothetical protein [Clostridiales bacterium]
MDKQKIIAEFVEFVEGRMPFDEFEHNYKTNPDYFKVLEDKKPNKKFPYQKGKTINQCLRWFKWESTRGKVVVHDYIMRYLLSYKFSVIPTTYYIDELKFRAEIQPSYIEIEDEDFLNTIIATAPTELTKAQKKQWLKEKLKSLFKYDNKPPRWIQDPEWPIVNGEPLIFKSQTKERKDDERVFYTFYHPKTGEETIIEQAY